MKPLDLKNAGLNTKEATTYLSILELGEASMGQLVKKSKLKRTTLYDLVESLKEKGLISTAKQGKKILYVAENPSMLVEQMEERKQALEKIVPELLSIANGITNKPKVRYFEGTEGIKEVYRDVLRHPRQKIQAWAPENIIYDLDKSFFDDFYTPRLLKQNMFIELIAPNLPIFKNHKDSHTIPTRTIKLVDPEDFPFSVEVCLYGINKLGIMSYKDQMGLIIESESISNTLRSIFALQWKLLG